MGYSHTQHGVIRPILLLASAGAAAVGVLQHDPLAAAVATVVAGVFAITSFAFGSLTIEDRGDRLGARFGPIPLFRKSIAYSDITAVERDRSTFLAGWGIHYTRKGWLWNIGGFDCVRIETRRSSTLLGTDDPDGLVSFLQSRVGGKRTGPAQGP